MPKEIEDMATKRRERSTAEQRSTGKSSTRAKKPTAGTTAAARKAAPKKGAAKKAAPKKAAPKKTAARKAVARKATPKKSATSAARPKRTTRPATALARPAGGGSVPLKANPDAKLTPGQVRQLYERLIEERRRIQRSIRRHVSEATGDVERYADETDLAERSTREAYLLRFADKENKLLREINRALEKFSTGDYGICEGSGEPIGFKRLQLRPWTRYSVQYKEEVERERREARIASRR